MSEINGINPASAPRPVSTSASARPPKPQPKPQPSDTVEISPQAMLRSRMAGIPDVRADLVARVRAEIQAGTYETPEKLDIALSRLMDEMSL